jgi:hypothetical protein
MPAAAYIVWLAVTLLVFVVLIPVAVIGGLYMLENTPGWRSAGLGFGYVAFFIGIPLWIFAFGIALWRIARARIVAVGLPGWVGFLLFILVAADWRFFLWMFQPLFAPFLAAAAVMLVALALLPDRTDTAAGKVQQPGIGERVASAALGIETVLASVSLVGSLAWAFTAAMPFYRLDVHARQFAGWWTYVLAAALVWSIVEARRRMRAA